MHAEGPFIETGPPSGPRHRRRVLIAVWTVLLASALVGYLSTRVIVTGRVVLDGHPVAGAAVMFWIEESGAGTGEAVEAGGQPGVRQLYVARAASNGRYWFWNLPPGDYAGAINLKDLAVRRPDIRIEQLRVRMYSDLEGQRVRMEPGIHIINFTAITDGP